MSNDVSEVEKAYASKGFMGSTHARPIRILAEYLHPEARFEALKHRRRLARSPCRNLRHHRLRLPALHLLWRQPAPLRRAQLP